MNRAQSVEIDSSRLGLNEEFVTKAEDSDSKEGTPSPFCRNDETRRSKKSSKSDKSLKSTKASLHLPLDFNKVCILYISTVQTHQEKNGRYTLCV